MFLIAKPDPRLIPLYRIPEIVALLADDALFRVFARPFLVPTMVAVAFESLAVIDEIILNRLGPILTLHHRKCLRLTSLSETNDRGQNQDHPNESHHF